MKTLDDHSPAELDSRNQKGIAFLRLVNRRFVRAKVSSEDEKPVLRRVRQRLFEDSNKTLPPLKQHPSFLQKRDWPRRFALLAAMLIISLIVGSLLVLFNQQAHPALLSTQGSQAIYVLSGGWLQKFNAQNGKLLWKAQIRANTDQTKSSIFTPASNGIVYITTTEKISALKASDGSLLWSKDIPGELVYQTIFANNKLFILTQQGNKIDENPETLQAFDALTGREIWQFKQNGLFLSFAVDNSAIYGGINLRSPATSKNDPYTKFDLFALKAMDGSLLWRVHMDDPLLVSGSGEITSANGKVYVEANTLEETKNSANGYSHIYAYDANSGAYLWQTPDALNPILGDLLPGQQTVFAISGASLYAIYEPNGQRLWSYTNKSGGILHCSSVEQENVLFCLETEESHTYLVRFDISDGQVKGKYLVEPFGVEGVRISSSQSVTLENGASILLFPALLTDVDHSYVVTPTGNLDAFNNQTGKRIWSTPLIGMPGRVYLVPGN